MAADILVLATPTWVGQHCSVAQRVFERLDAELSQTDGRRTVEVSRRRPDGWLAFAGDEQQFCAQLDELSRISGRSVPTAVRIDATVLALEEAPPSPVAERGRVTGTIDQPRALLARWQRMPITHLLVNVRSPNPLHDLARLRQA